MATDFFSVVIFLGGVKKMAKIEDCIGKKVKISLNSITIKDEEFKTRGVVRNIISLADLHGGRKFDYATKVMDAGIHGLISIRDYIIHDEKMYVFRDMSMVLFHQKYGYWSEDEKNKMEEKQKIYDKIASVGFPIIECVFI